MLLSIPASFYGNPAPQSPNIGVSGNLTSDKVVRGRAAQGVVSVDIPPGFHIHSNKPLEKFLIATQLQIEGVKGVSIGPILYPRAVLRSLKFSKNKVAVYEGRVVIRFSVTVPANFNSDSTELKTRLRYQSCNDELCFPPQTREVIIPVRLK
jgi:hypothetical protein